MWLGKNFTITTYYKLYQSTSSAILQAILPHCEKLKNFTLTETLPKNLCFLQKSQRNKCFVENCTKEYTELYQPTLSAVLQALLPRA